MWQQLTYSLTRSTTPLLLRGVQHLFTLFTVINYKSKTFYEQFILKKLEFGKLL